MLRDASLAPMREGFVEEVILRGSHPDPYRARIRPSGDKTVIVSPKSVTVS